MKFRTDFVTNSSSSSFIIAFNDKDQTIEELKAHAKSEILSSGENDIERMTEWSNEMISNLLHDENIVSREELDSILNEELSSEARYILFWSKSRRLPFEYLESEEYKQKEKEYIAKRKEEILKFIPEDAKILSVSVGDDDLCGSLFEHYILPKSNCVFAQFSHH